MKTVSLYVTAVFFSLFIFACGGPIEGSAPDEGGATSNIFDLDLDVNCVDGDVREECKDALAALEVTATPDAYLTLSVKRAGSEEIENIKSFTASVSATEISTELRAGDRVIFSGLDLCEGGVKVYVVLVYLDGDKSEPILLDKCLDGNLVAELTPSTDLLTAGSSIEYSNEETDGTGGNDDDDDDNTDPDPVTTVNPGNGSPSLSSGQEKINFDVTVKGGLSGLDWIKVWSEAVTSPSNDSRLVFGTNVVELENYAYTTGSILTLQTKGDNVEEYAAEYQGTVQTALFSVVVSLPDSDCAFEVVRSTLWADNNRDGGNIRFSVREHNGVCQLRNSSNQVVASY